MKYANRLIDRVLEAKQVGVLYHWTSGEGMVSILKDNGFRRSPENPGPRGVSFSRDKRLNFATGGEAIRWVIVVDGDAVSEHYKVSPYADPNVTDRGNVIKASITGYPDTESEERVVVPLGKKLGPLNRFVIKICWAGSYGDLEFLKRTWRAWRSADDDHIAQVADEMGLEPVQVETLGQHYYEVKTLADRVGVKLGDLF